jgi:hypothetical protein
MVIDAHDVTPVPGYGAHGPFYRLYTIRPGDLAKIKWKGVWRTYRFVTHPFAKPQRSRTEASTTHLSRAGRARWCISDAAGPAIPVTPICMKERC